MDHHDRRASNKNAEPDDAEFRVESSKPAWGSTWPQPGAREATFSNRHLAVAVAAKARTRGAVQVVHVKSGEVVFRKDNDAERPDS